MEVETVAGANATPDLGVPISPIDDGFGKGPLSADNVSDIDVIPGKEKVVQDAGAPAKTEADAKSEADKAKEAETARFDKHPDWQRMMKERDEAKLEAARLKGQIEAMSPAQKKEAEARESQELPYKDITLMTKEELLEWQEDDPKGYAANLYQQVLHETRMTIKDEQTQAHRTTSVKGTFDNYAKENPDFTEKWNSGEIKAFMDANPGHNAISAHMIMTEKSRIDAAVAKAVKETEEKVIRNFQAKKNARVISEGGTVRTQDGVPDELANPDKYGGTTAALALRLSRLRQQPSA